MKKIMFFVMAVVACVTVSASADVASWQAQAQATANNVVADTNGGAGYVFDGSAGISYDYGDLSQGDTGTIGAGVTIEYIFNLADSGDSIALGTTHGWVNAEINGIKLEQYPATGLFGTGIETFWDLTFDGAPSVFDADTHAVVVYGADGYTELYVDGVSKGSDGRAGGWVVNGGVGSLGSTSDLATDIAVGTIYGVGSYDRALDATDVAALYDAYTTSDNAGLVYPTPNGTDNVPVDANLVWGPPPIMPNYYDLYFGTDPNTNTWNQTPDFVKKLDKQNQTEYDPGNMPFETTHYWRVDAYEPNTAGEILRVGGIWSFTTISDLPEILTHPQSVTVAAGDEAVFTVGGLNLLTKKWYKDNVIITGETSDTLTISNVQLGNEGVYHCIVGNGNGAFDISTVKARLLTNRLMAHWKFEGDLTDEVESIVGFYTDPNAANPTPTPTYDPNYVEGSQSFRFEPGPYFIRADLADYFNFYPQGYTVSAWIKTTQTSPWGAYVSKQDIDPQRGFILTHDDTGQAVHTLRQSFNDLNSGVQIDDGKWHLVVGTYDAATGEGKVYVDGELANQATNAGVLETSAAPLIFGAELTTGVIPYIGLLDEVRIYSYPQHPYEIAHEYVAIVPTASICVAHDPTDPTTDIEYDHDGDCDIDLADFAGYFIKQWLNCNRVAGTGSGLFDCK
jgi:hypothetical protein